VRFSLAKICYLFPGWPFPHRLLISCATAVASDSSQLAISRWDHNRIYAHREIVGVMRYLRDRYNICKLKRWNKLPAFFWLPAYVKGLGKKMGIKKESSAKLCRIQCFILYESIFSFPHLWEICLSHMTLYPITSKFPHTSGKVFSFFKEHSLSPCLSVFFSVHYSAVCLSLICCQDRMWTNINVSIFPLSYTMLSLISLLPNWPNYFCWVLIFSPR